MCDAPHKSNHSDSDGTEMQVGDRNICIVEINPEAGCSKGNRTSDKDRESESLPEQRSVCWSMRGSVLQPGAQQQAENYGPGNQREQSKHTTHHRYKFTIDGR